MKEQKKEFFLSVHMLRGIAAFLVMLCHSPKGFEARMPALTALLNPLGAGVNTFLVISGFIIPFSMYKANYQVKDFRNFMAKRLVRLEPPYIVSIIMALVLNYLNIFLPWNKGMVYHVDWGWILRHLAYINAFTGEHWINWVYWTLAVEFQFYLLLSVLFPLITSSDKRVMFATFFGLMALSFIHIEGRPYLIFAYLPMFLMGISLFLYMTGKTKVQEFFIMLIPSMVTFSLVYIIYRHMSFKAAPLMYLGAFVAIPVIYYIKKVPKPLLWLGTISYSMYLTHMLITTRFIMLFDKYLHLPFLAAWLLCVVCTTLFAWLFYLAIEKPFLNLSKKIRVHRG